jgi:hypothetical protein
MPSSEFKKLFGEMSDIFDATWLFKSIGLSTGIIEMRAHQLAMRRCRAGAHQSSQVNDRLA